jgi:hypothetical protein
MPSVDEVFGNLNYHFAIACSGMAAFLAVMTLVLRAGGFTGVVALPRRLVYVSRVCRPIVAFLLAYFFRTPAWKHVVLV